MNRLEGLLTWAEAQFSTPSALPGRWLRAADLASLSPVHELPSPSGEAWLTEDGPHLAVRSGDGSLEILAEGQADMPWRANSQLYSLLGQPPVWSPDARRVLSLQADLSRCARQPLIDWRMAPPQVQLHWSASEQRARRPTGRLAIVDVAERKVLSVDLSEGELHLPVRWLQDGITVLLLTLDLDGAVALTFLDSHSGRVREVVREEVVNCFAYLPALLSAAAVPVQDRLLWASDRDGDLRLYDLSGTAPEALTPTGTQLVHVGPVAPTGELVVLARTDADNPYDVQICAIDRSSGFRVLSRSTGTHDLIAVAPDGAVLERRQQPGSAAGLTWRVLDGSVADRPLPPLPSTPELTFEPVRVLAADGHTKLHGALFLPDDWQPDGSFPVVDVLYGGPQTIAHPTVPMPLGHSLWGSSPLLAQLLAARGFAALVLDARGTPGRGRAFQRAETTRPGHVVVEDHRAALLQLGERYPWLDLGRCSALGTSFGGYYAARCGLLYPELFRAVVAHAAPLDLEQVMPGWFGGLLGQRIEETPDRWRDAGLIDHAKHFRARLLLLHGTHDRNVPLAHSLRFSAALTDAGVHHELLLLDGQDHQLTGAAARQALDAAARFLGTQLGGAR